MTFETSILLPTLPRLSGQLLLFLFATYSTNKIMYFLKLECLLSLWFSFADSANCLGLLVIYQKIVISC